jgi:hypothetical protein
MFSEKRIKEYALHALMWTVHFPFYFSPLFLRPSLAEVFAMCSAFVFTP